MPDLAFHFIEMSQHDAPVSQKFEEKQSCTGISDPRKYESRDCAVKRQVAIEFLQDCTDSGCSDYLPSLEDPADQHHREQIQKSDGNKRPGVPVDCGDHASQH